MRARIRSIKPEVLLDEDLWDFEQETGLPIYRAFTGLWCCSDREGRFEWRPRPLKILVLPYWDGDFSRVLDAMATRGYIGKYTVGTHEYGVVRTFRKHQSINNKEAESILPAPPKNLFDSEDLDAMATREPRDDDATGTPDARKGKERKGARVVDASPEFEEKVPHLQVARIWRDVTGTIFEPYHFREDFESIHRQATVADEGDPLRAVKFAAETCWADPWVSGTKQGPGHLAKYFGKYAGTSARPVKKQTAAERAEQLAWYRANGYDDDGNPIGAPT